MIGLGLPKLHTGKASGHDNISVEHLTNCHPVIHSLLAKIFNCIISTHVPADFGMAIVIPIPKSEPSDPVNKPENFRGITLSPIISQLFEHCIIDILYNFLHTSDNQFGFKKKLSYTHASFTMRQFIEHYVNNDSTVNVCLVDVSKAFDKVNHSLMFMKLMDRGVPISFIRLLDNWYRKMYSRIKWKNTLSTSFQLLCGVKQGGVLSPLLFTIYVDDLLLKLRKFGCRMLGTVISAIMYAMILF